MVGILLFLFFVLIYFPSKVRAATLFQPLPQPIINFLHSVQSVNEAIQKPFRNSPWFQKTTSIITSPDSVVLKSLKAVGEFFKKIIGVGAVIAKAIGNGFVWVFELLARLLKLGLN